jgi:3-hydroxyisobutyrate dehydrogenase-like beta-hydroxyacid dehydrogenase
MARVTTIGLGNMGATLARTLLDAGHAVTATTRPPRSTSCCEAAADARQWRAAGAASNFVSGGRASGPTATSISHGPEARRAAS